MEQILYEGFNDKMTDLRLFRAKNVHAPRHFHRCFEMIYVIDGAMNSTVDDQKIRATADDVVFVQKYYAHSYHSTEDYRKIVLIIPTNLYRDFEKQLSVNTLPAHLTDKTFNRTLLPLLEHLLEHFQEKTPLIKKGYMDILIGELVAHYPAVPVAQNDRIDLLVRILDYIDEHYDEPLTLESISAEFGYNKYYFSRLFNRCMGENLSRYINLVRLQRMMALAAASEKPNITELAFACGFDSLSTFYRYFGQVYGQSPTEALRDMPGQA